MDCCNDNDKKYQKKKKELANSLNKENLVKRIALIGNPNVGKSVVFNALTGAYVTVSNYPGTTVEVSKGFINDKDLKCEVVDTPGMYSILPITDEEMVTRRLLISEKPDLVIHVVDAKNLQRMLPLTLQLLEADQNVILVLNIMDEAEAIGMKIDIRKLSDLLGIPVVGASAALNQGIDEIKNLIRRSLNNAA
jgi:small GTP-binding protein domain